MAAKVGRRDAHTKRAELSVSESKGNLEKEIGRGADNAALYPSLKEQLISENIAKIAAHDARLAAAIKGTTSGKVNFGIGQATVAEANRLGKIWVGDGAIPLKKHPGGYISADGTRVYRPPVKKPSIPLEFSQTGIQANFEQLKNGTVISNGHLGIINP